MLFDRLLTAYARAESERQFRFGEEAAGGMPFPQPLPGHHYLLYLHVPFCEALCPFCPFHRVLFDEAKCRRYFAALRKEIQLAGRTGFEFGEVYVGGGTPTVLVDELVETLALLKAEHPVDCVSVETNPAHLDPARLAKLVANGVNRLSVGVQSFDDRILRDINRFDKYGSGREIQAKLRGIAGMFDTLNVDMIFNFPGQTTDQLISDAQMITDELAVDQVSFYPLMVASATRRFLEKEMGGVDYDRERSLYSLIAEHMVRRGYRRTSSWCFSKKAGMIDEYITDNDQYLGLGSGAFSYLDGSFFSSTFSINRYIALAGSGGTGLVKRRRMTLREQMRYFLLMRLFGGRLNFDEAEKVFDGEFERDMQAELLFLLLTGSVKRRENALELTEAGQYLCVLLMREFFIGVNNFRDQMRRNIPRERELAGLQDRTELND